MDLSINTAIWSLLHVFGPRKWAGLLDVSDYHIIGLLKIRCIYEVFLFFRKTNYFTPWIRLKYEKKQFCFCTHNNWQIGEIVFYLFCYFYLYCFCFVKENTFSCDRNVYSKKQIHFFFFFRNEEICDFPNLLDLLLLNL